MNNQKKPVSNLKINVRLSDTDLFKRLVQLLCEVKDDERVPVDVRSEVEDKVNDILLELMRAE